MDRAELGALLRLLVDSGRITAAEAAQIIVRFDLGEIVSALLPVRLADLPGRLTPQELAVAMRDVAVRLTPKQAAPFLTAATRPVTTATPPEVKKFLRDRLRNSFRADYERTIAGYTKALANGGNVDIWHKRMIAEQRAYIARMSTAGHGRPLAASELDTVNRISAQQQIFLQRFVGEISARRLAGRPHSEAYLQARSAQYGGAGWEAWHRADEAAQTLAQDGYIVHYEAVDSPSTCSPCLNAQNGGPYLAGSSYPRPGQVCRGHGHCRCVLRIEFNMEAWRELRGAA